MRNIDDNKNKDSSWDDTEYEHDIVIIKDYVVAKRLIYLPTVYSPEKDHNRKEKVYTPKGSVNDIKLENNLIRARGKILEYALCNKWEWFFTATIDGSKYDRTDLDKYRKDFTRFLQKFGREHNLNIKYLIVPELHADRKNWHAHGFIMGLPQEYLKEFKMKKKLPLYIRKKLENNEKVYEFKEYTDKFGFNDFEKIKDLRRSATYITKYLTKDLGRAVSELGMHTYFSSKGLKKAEVIDRGLLNRDIPLEFDFENEYVGIKWFDKDDEPERYIYQGNTFDEWIEIDWSPFDDEDKSA